MGEFTDKIKGKAKQVEGRITGDSARRTEGKLDEAKGNLKGVVHKIKDATKNIVQLSKGAMKNDKK